MILSLVLHGLLPSCEGGGFSFTSNKDKCPCFIISFSCPVFLDVLFNLHCNTFDSCPDLELVGSIESDLRQDGLTLQYKTSVRIPGFYSS